MDLKISSLLPPTSRLFSPGVSSYRTKDQLVLDVCLIKLDDCDLQRTTIHFVKGKNSPKPIPIPFIFIPFRSRSQAAAVCDLRVCNGIARYAWRKNTKRFLCQNLIDNLLDMIVFGAIPLPSKSQSSITSKSLVKQYWLVLSRVASLLKYILNEIITVQILLQVM